MTWTNVASHISFSTSSWSILTGSNTVTDLSGPDQTAVLNQLQSIYTSSALGATILDSLTSGGAILRIGQSGSLPGFFQPAPSGYDDYFGFNRTADADTYYFNDQGYLVADDFRLDLIHELAHKYFNAQDPTVSLTGVVSGLDFDFKGQQVGAQNTVAGDLGLSNNIQASYHAGGQSSDPVVSQISTGTSYSLGRHIDIALFGGDGASDTIDLSTRSDSSSDLVLGMGGDDTIATGAGDDNLYGGNGADSLDGGVGADFLRGDAGADTLNGGDGNDTLIGGQGADVYLGGDGEDRIVIGTDTDGSADGGAGTDTLSLEGYGFGANLTLGTGAVTVGTTSLDHFEHYVGTAYNDTLSIAGSDGLVVDGFVGDDSISGGSGVDTLLGGSGADTLQGGEGDDSLAGGDGDDQFLSDGASPGFDMLDGGAGADSLVGAADDAVIGVKSMSGIEAITAQAFSNVLIQGDSSANVWDLSGVVVTGSISFDGADGDDTLIASDAAGTNFTYLQGGNGADSLVGGVQSNILYGGDGDDTLALSATSYGIDAGGDDTWVLPTVSGISASMVSANIDGVPVDVHDLEANVPRIAAYWSGTDVLKVGSTEITTLSAFKTWEQDVSGSSHDGLHLISIGETDTAYDFILDTYIDPNDGLAHVMLSFTGDISDAWLNTSLDQQGMVDAAEGDGAVASANFEAAYWAGLGLTVTGVDAIGDLGMAAAYGPSAFNDFI